MTKIMSFVMIGLVVCTLTSSGAVFGMSCGSDMSGSHAPESAKPEDSSKAIDAGNKICPVLGEPIDEAAKTTYEYEGKIYNFCCAGCIDEFKKEPQKYIDKVNQELQDNQSTK